MGEDITLWCNRECSAFASISGRGTAASVYHRRYASVGREDDCFTRTPVGVSPPLISPRHLTFASTMNVLTRTR